MKITILFALCTILCVVYCKKNNDKSLTLNQLQYVSSHNSYKGAFPSRIVQQFWKQQLCMPPFDENCQVNPVVSATCMNVNTLSPDPRSCLSNTLLSFITQVPPFNQLPNVENYFKLFLMTIEYGHPSIESQLENGIRSFEIDLYWDSNGDNYKNVWSGTFVPGTAQPLMLVDERLNNPGESDIIRVLHTPIIDTDTHCASFKECLQQFATFSKSNSGHVPIFISLELKQFTGLIKSVFASLGIAVDSPGWDANKLKAVVQLIDEYLPPDAYSLYFPTPNNNKENFHLKCDDPTLKEARGRFVFVVDVSTVDISIEEAEAAVGDRIFIAGQDNIQLGIQFDPTKNDNVCAGVDDNKLVRARAELETFDGRNNFPFVPPAFNSLKDFVLSSECGAHFISTNFLGHPQTSAIQPLSQPTLIMPQIPILAAILPSDPFISSAPFPVGFGPFTSEYAVKFEGNLQVRCNPRTSDQDNCEIAENGKSKGHPKRQLCRRLGQNNDKKGNSENGNKSLLATTTTTTVTATVIGVVAMLIISVMVIKNYRRRRSSANMETPDSADETNTLEMI